MPHELRLTLLGDCRVELNEAPLADLALAKARALLCYLAVTGRPQSRSAVASLLWGELTEADARRNLRVVLARLHNAAGDYVLATRSEICFNQSLPCVLDVAIFERGAQASAAMPAEFTPDVVAEMEQCMALYRGEFMHGLEVRHAPAFEEWLLMQREHLRRQALQMGERLARYYEASRRDADAIAMCKRLIALEPWQESEQRRLMLLLARSGQPAAALREFEGYRRALDAELKLAPDAATMALAEQIQSDMLSQNAQVLAGGRTTRPAYNLPAPTTSFIGRNAELAKIDSLLHDPGCRLLTLIGIGGAGKTRLALQAARQIVAAWDADKPALFRHGVVFVSLAAVNTADQVVVAIANAMNFNFSGQQDMKAQLLNHLKEREVLLVLDNFEHIVSDAGLLAEILHAGPHVKLLVTSRERLDLYEEWLLDVDGLPVPLADTSHLNPAERSDARFEYGAIQLFAQRAGRLSQRFDQAGNAEAIEGICRLMDGLPLGIELAAGWVRTHTCDEILRTIRHNLDFLSTPARNVPERHRSLRVAFDYSWDMLDEEDAGKLSRLAAFRGSFDDAAAEVVAGASTTDLNRLADKSLVERAGEDRWSIHPMLRQYLAECLTKPAWDEVQHDHCRFYAGYVAQWAPARETADEPAALMALQNEIADLRAAWEWLVARVRLAGGSFADARDGEMMALIQQFAPMWAYFQVRRCWYQEGWHGFLDARQAMRESGWHECSRDRPHDGTEQRPAALALVESLLAEFAFSLSRYEDVVVFAEQALPALRNGSDPVAVAEALARLGKAHVRMGHYAEAEPALLESLLMYRAAGDQKGSTAALNWLAAWHSNQGQFDEAQAYFEACLAVFRESGYRRGIANTLNNLGSNFGRNDQFVEEQSLYEEAYQLALETGEPILIAVTLSNMADNARSLKHFDKSIDCYQTSLAHCRAIGERRWVAANLNGLAFTLLDMGEWRKAGEKLHEAMAIAREIRSVPDILDALGGLGEVLAKQERFEPASIVLSFVIHHHVTHRMARERSRLALAGIPGNRTAAMPVHPNGAQLGLDEVVTLATNPPE